MKKILSMLLASVMVLSLAACGTKGGDKMDGMSSEPKNAEEAVAMHKDLMAQENAILSENTALWEKVFMAADKGMTMQEDGKNYGDFLLSTIESAKDQFTEDELKLLKEGAEKIRDIETKLTMIEEKYPEAAQESTDGAMSVPAGNDTTTPPDDGSMQKSDDGSMQKFPTFEGKDLDGNTVKSDELFSANAVTVVNFWFTTCVGELAELDALNKELAEKGGSLIGVNTFTLDGDEAAISEAKDVLLAYFAKGLGIAEITRQVVVFAHDHTADSRILGFVILVRNAVVADQRIGHHDHLVGIGGIGENLLVADHRGIEHDLARRLPVRAETVAVELAARLKHDFFGEWFHIRLFRNLSSFIFQFPALFPASGRIRDGRSHRPSKNGIAFRIPIRDNPRTSLPPRLSETLRRVCRTSPDQRPERTARNPPAGKRCSAAFRQEGFGIDLVLRIEVEHR